MLHGANVATSGLDVKGLTCSTIVATIGSVIGERQIRFGFHTRTICSFDASPRSGQGEHGLQPRQLALAAALNATDASALTPASVITMTWPRKRTQSQPAIGLSPRDRGASSQWSLTDEY